MKKITTTALFFLSALSGLWAQNATVDLSSKHQVIQGFGGINHPVWYSDLNASERDLAFGNGEGQMGLNVLRVWVSPDPNQWPLGLETAQRAVELGGIVFATPWMPPSSMTWDDNGQTRINTSKYAEYAAHLNDYVTYMRNNGVELYGISTQNEPDYAHEWCEWTPEESVAFIKGYADDIDCRIITPESFQYRKDIYDPILNDADALSKVDIFGTHLYGTPVSNFSYSLFEQKGAGKELWMTEVYTDSGYDGNIWDNAIINEKHHALYVAQHIHHAMVTGNFQTYVYWPIRRHYALIHDGTNATNAYSGVSPAAAGTVTKRGYAMAQFAKFVRPGYIRVGATENPVSGVYVSAYEKDGDVVIVAVNQTTSAKTISFSVPGTQVVSWQPYTTSATKDLNKEAMIDAGGTFQVSLDAASVTSFVGSADAGAPSISISVPAGASIYEAPATISVTADASDDDGSITKVEFYLDDQSVAEINTAPYTWDFENLAEGEYALRAVATDDEGKTAEDRITVTVYPPQEPYNGTPFTIPGVIECEEFDLGGNGFAYFDDSEGSETAVDFRADTDVDFEVCTDDGGGYNLGYWTSGEWLEYTVNIEQTGTYSIDFRGASSGASKTISLSMDGTDIAADVVIPDTEGWQTYTSVTVDEVSLTAGEHILRLTMGADDYVNMNKMTFALTSQPQTVHLKAGWNLVGCPVQGSNIAIESLLSSIWEHAVSVKNAEGFYNIGNPVFLNSLTELEYGRGYFIKVDANCELDWIAR